ncbi:glycosyltransferase family 2 protein [Streptococcus hillyeri]|uniref:Glycosyltransferase family 2 protein n=1 Tax=Streptococcus hillyeri TaxID=2282420 RepID=A0A3L9DUL4_9STRE|nr:glycosyltransferase family 2 protein [Streptococcus hillyeri]RLY02430.1 glycosyltransferase family 2 protein [Streptococcus hillyeri]
MSKVSVIVPIYNVGKYLRKCLESIQSQTYRNFEVILVDDGSDDCSIEIAKDFSQIDDRFYYLRKENGGLSSARNSGLEKVSGEFVLFVDGDDFIETNCIEELILLQKSSGADVVLFPFTKFYGNKTEECSIIPTFVTDEEMYRYVHQRIFGLTNIQLKEPLTSERLNTVWGKLYSFDKIRHIKFTDTKLIGSEDVYYNAQVFNQALNVAYCGATRYHYRKDNENSLTTVYNKELSERHHRLYESMFAIIDEYHLGCEFRESLNNRVILNLFPLMANIINSRENYRFKVQMLEKLLSNSIYREKFKTFEFSNLPTIWKLFYQMCKMKNVTGLIFLVQLMYQVRKIRNGG